ncbi:MAG: hypothetical protein ABWX83_15895 [Luteibacter sp.]
MKSHSRLLCPAFLVVSLVAAPVAAASEPSANASTVSVPVSAMLRQEQTALRQLTADGLVMASVNGASVFASGAYASDEPFMGDPDGVLYFYIRHTAAPRGTGFLVSVPAADGNRHVQSGRYELANTDGIVPVMNYFEPVVLPSGYSGWEFYGSEKGWLELKFNADRSHVDGTFEFDGVSDDGKQRRTIRKGTFSMPYSDSEGAVTR